MSRRRQIDEPAAIADKRRNPVDQDKVAQVIRPKLRFEAVHCLAERCGHHARISDHHVEWFPLGNQFVSARAHTFEAGKIELN